MCPFFCSVGVWPAVHRESLHLQISIHPMPAPCRRLGLDPGPVEGAQVGKLPEIWKTLVFIREKSIHFSYQTCSWGLPSMTLKDSLTGFPFLLWWWWIFVGRPGQSRQRRLELRQAGLRWNHMFGRETSLWNRWRRKQRQSFQVPKAKLQMEMAGASNCGTNRFVAKSF